MASPACSVRKVGFSVERMICLTKAWHKNTPKHSAPCGVDQRRVSTCSCKARNVCLDSCISSDMNLESSLLWWVKPFHQVQGVSKTMGEKSMLCLHWYVPPHTHLLFRRCGWQQGSCLLSFLIWHSPLFAHMNTQTSGSYSVLTEESCSCGDSNKNARTQAGEHKLNQSVCAP